MPAEGIPGLGEKAEEGSHLQGTEGNPGRSGNVCEYMFTCAESLSIHCSTKAPETRQIAVRNTVEKPPPLPKAPLM